MRKLRIALDKIIEDLADVLSDRRLFFQRPVERQLLDDPSDLERLKVDAQVLLDERGVEGPGIVAGRGVSLQFSLRHGGPPARSPPLETLAGRFPCRERSPRAPRASGSRARGPAGSARHPRPSTGPCA